MNKIFYIFLISTVINFGCSDSNSTQSTGQEEENEDSSWKLEDGDYCADVIYNNPSNGYRASYDLTVEVIDNTPTKIYFCNGGYLHNFTAPELDESHSCSFTSSEGKQYKVTLSEEQCSRTERCSDEESAVYSFDYCCQILALTSREIQVLETNLAITKGELITGSQIENIREYIKSYRALNSINAEIANGYVEDFHTLSLHGEIHCQVMIIKKRGMYYLFEVAGQNEVITGTLDFDETDSGWQNVIVKHDPEGNEIKAYYIKLLESDSNKEYLKRRKEVYCHF
jgi:hypothetical protein